MSTYIVAGVSGSGKTTLAKALSEVLEIPFLEGDDYHPDANVKKMREGVPLVDEDRWPWLAALNSALHKHPSCVLACSALKEKYREKLVEGLNNDVIWLMMEGDYEVIHKRMVAREHFMPPSLLRAQYEDYESPDYGHHMDVTVPLDQMIKQILAMDKTEFGLAGLGVMGRSLARNLGRNGYKLSLYNRHVSGEEEEVANRAIQQYEELKVAKGYDDVSAFVASLVTPRKIFMMVPAGTATDTLIAELTPLLEAGDIIIDGGNALYKDTVRRQQTLSQKNISHIGCGVSGGELGALNGPAIMPGGSTEAYAHVKPFLENIAAKDKDGLPCCGHVGEGGAGHFVKMIHNGIEYAEMQLLAELSYALHHYQGRTYKEIADLFSSFHAKEAGSYLLEITIDILRSEEDGVPMLDLILDKAGNKGTGGWSTTAAAEYGYPGDMISTALFCRYVSAHKAERQKAAPIYQQESGKISLSDETIYEAYQTARIINHHQGLSIIQAASDAEGWQVDLTEVARIWTNGCIIRSKLMAQITKASINDTPLLMIPTFSSYVHNHISSLEKLVSTASAARCPLPNHSSALQFLLSYTLAEGSASLIQAQRDYFGAHTFKRKDDPEGPSHHRIWKKT